MCWIHCNIIIKKTEKYLLQQCSGSTLQFPSSLHDHFQSKSQSRDRIIVDSKAYPKAFQSVQSLSRVHLFVTPWITACQASLSITNSWSSLKLMSIESVMPSSHLILGHLLLLLPPIPPSTRVFSNESILHMRWPEYWSFSFSISPSNEHSGLTSFRMDWLDLFAVQGTLKKSSPTPQFKSINSLVFSFLNSPTVTSIHDHWKNHSLD